MLRILSRFSGSLRRLMLTVWTRLDILIPQSRQKRPFLPTQMLKYRQGNRPRQFRQPHRLRDMNRSRHSDRQRQAQNGCSPGCSNRRMPKFRLTPPHPHPLNQTSCSGHRMRPWTLSQFLANPMPAFSDHPMPPQVTFRVLAKPTSAFNVQCRPRRRCRYSRQYSNRQGHQQKPRQYSSR